MTLKQWHSNDRKSKINTRTRVKNLKNWQSGKHTTTMVTTYYWIYLNRKRLRIIKDLRLKLLQTGSCKLWSLERSPYGLLLTGGSRECRQSGTATGTVPGTSRWCSSWWATGTCAVGCGTRRRWGSSRARCAGCDELAPWRSCTSPAASRRSCDPAGRDDTPSPDWNCQWGPSGHV